MKKEDLAYLWSRWLNENKDRPLFNQFYSGAQSFYLFIEDYLDGFVKLGKDSAVD